MHQEERLGFVADEAGLDMDSYLVFDYWFESVTDPEEAAVHLCREQSTAQWKRVGVDEDFRPLFGAKVIALRVEHTSEKPTYPFSGIGGTRFHRCRVRIAYPQRNLGPSIPSLLTAACGEGAFFSPGISSIKLLDIEFPDSYLQSFKGPKFGVEGIRSLLGVYDRPILLGVVKPNIGLPPEAFAELAYQGWLGGLDIAKDDELLGDVAWSPLSVRAERTGKARLKAEQVTGEKKMYLANITDEVDRLLELHDIAVGRGANALMVNGMTTGLSAVRMLRKHTDVPLFGHFDFIAPFTRMPYFGVSSRLITKLQRLVGFDCIIVPGTGERMKTPDREVALDVETCLEPMGHVRKSLPVPAGSQWAGSTGELYRKLGTVDFGIVPGRAVFEHPMGPRAGAASLRQGWEAVRKGVTLEEYAEDHTELSLAIQAVSG